MLHLITAETKQDCKRGKNRENLRAFIWENNGERKELASPEMHSE